MNVYPFITESLCSGVFNYLTLVLDLTIISICILEYYFLQLFVF